MNRRAKSMASGGAPARWSRASAMVFVIAGVGSGVTDTRAQAQEVAEPDPVPVPSLRHIARIMRPTDAIEWTGLGLMVLSLVLLASSQYLGRSRRALVVLICGILFLGMGGYVLYDHYYVFLNVRLLAAGDAVIADCERWIQSKPAGLAGIVQKQGLPESLQRLGITIAYLEPPGALLYDAPETSNAILYDPEGLYRNRSWKRESDSEIVRRTWVPGFYKHHLLH